FPSFFKTLVDHEVTIELKNDLSIRGTLKSVDQFLNIKLDDITVIEEGNYPHLSAVKNVFIRGSVVRYVHLPANAVDTALLEDATRRGMGHPLGIYEVWLEADYISSGEDRGSKHGSAEDKINFHRTILVYWFIHINYHNKGSVKPEFIPNMEAGWKQNRILAT
ncbi:hypothetical protein BGX38DRAFT_1102888, partial [Terfezia claveryi]